MAKHQRRWFAPEQLSQPYHDEMHLQSHHQKYKFVTKPNLRAVKNPLRSDFARKNRYYTVFNTHNTHNNILRSILHLFQIVLTRDSIRPQCYLQKHFFLECKK